MITRLSGAGTGPPTDAGRFARRWLRRAVVLSAFVAVAGITAAVVRAAAPEASRPDPYRGGRARYTQFCMPCHGESGRGDGPSAGALATKPADFTDGRVMNVLPDDFLVNVILHGGPAEGLAPTMPRFEGYFGQAEAREIVTFLRSLASPPFRRDAPRPIVSVAGAPRQPIFFSHLIHAGSFQIACQYCHPDARRGDYAGLPSVERCMGCHKIIGATDNPEIRKIHGYWERQEAIPWVRIFKVPEFVYFPHKPHIRGEVECQACHGPIERMRVVGGVTGPAIPNDLANLLGFHPAPRALSMGWCISCHRAENTKPGRKAPLDCAACHH